MNEQRFLHELRESLKGLPRPEIEDILYDYREHFQIGLKNGKSEEEIARKLGMPKKLGKQHRASYYIKTAEENKTPVNIGRAILAGLGLGFLNIIFVLPIFIAVLAVFISLFAAGIAIVLAGGGICIYAFFSSVMLPAVAYFLAGVAILSLGLLLLIGCLLLTKYFVAAVIKYFKANIQIISGKESIQNG